MIHIVHAGNRHLYARQLDEMFVQRRIMFYERAGWRDLQLVDGREIDDFDDDRAVYLIALNDDEELEGSVRTRPTDDRCILVDKFPDLVAPDQPPLKGPEVWESTRIFTTDAYRRTRQPGARMFHALALAAKEVAFEAGCRRMIGMCDIRLLPHITDGPVEVQLAGLPRPYPYGTWIGTWVHVTETVILKSRDSMALSTRISYAVTDSDLRRHGSLAAVQRFVDAERRGEQASIEDERREPASRTPAAVQPSGAVS